MLYLCAVLARSYAARRTSVCRPPTLACRQRTTLGTEQSPIPTHENGAQSTGIWPNRLFFLSLCIFWYDNLT